jgi:hypothetical protein
MRHPRPRARTWASGLGSEATAAALIQWLHRDVLRSAGDAETVRLLEELLPVSEHQHPLLHVEERRHRGEHDGLPRAGGQRNEDPPRARQIARSNALEALVLIGSEPQRSSPRVAVRGAGSGST